MHTVQMGRTMHHITKKEVHHFCLIVLVVTFGFEGLAACHLWISEKDILTSILIVVGWFKDGLKVVLEHLAADL